MTPRGSFTRYVALVRTRSNHQSRGLGHARVRAFGRSNGSDPLSDSDSQAANPMDLPLKTRQALKRPEIKMQCFTTIELAPRSVSLFTISQDKPCRLLVHAVAVFRLPSSRPLGDKRCRAPGVDVGDVHIGTRREILVLECLPGHR